jgi:hypothetical protein
VVNKGAPIRNTSLNGVTKKENDIKSFSIFYQIRGLRGKSSELLSHLHPVSHHILCFTEHHMNLLELQHLNIDSYILGQTTVEPFMKKEGFASIYTQV